MAKKTIIINNEKGIHATLASLIVTIASKYKSHITLKKTDSFIVANAKSIVFILSLGIGKGDYVEIEAFGDDETEAINELSIEITKYQEV